MSKNILNEELGRIKSLFLNKNQEVISEQNTIPGGIPQKAYDKIMSISQENKKKLSGSYLASAQQRVIDSEFGAGTYEKFFNNGGRDVLDGKKVFKLSTVSTNQKGNDKQTNINNVFCNVKGGVIILPNSKQNNVKWEDYKKVYKLNQNEILAAAKTCPNAELSKTVKTNKNTNVDVNNRFTKSASSLGIQNAKMDVQSLQTILNQLSGTQSSTVATGGQQPDLAALQNTLNQLTTS